MLHSVYKGLDEREDTALIMLDISKAFDKVWHPGLLFKLKQLGISGSLLRWFESYLTNRKQRVVLGGKSSELSYLQAGVPQGSILGPLLFLVYINDLPTNLTIDSHLFADDTTLLYSFKDPVVATQVLNHNLEILSKWADQ